MINNCKVNVLTDRTIDCRYLATITIDSVQYKTYPQTYVTKEEAEEAVSDIAIKQIGSAPLSN